VRVVVVVPTYNERGNIEPLLTRIRAALPDAGVLVVDDQSPDGTADVAEEVGRTVGDVVVLRRSHKEGLGAAYRAGFAQAMADGADICVQMDADLSHDPGDLPALVSAVVHGADASIGSRYVPGGRIEEWPPLRRGLSRWGNRYAAMMLGLAVNDGTSGFRAYSADGYGFQVEMTNRLVRIGGRIVEIPITFRDRTVGESKLSKAIIDEAFFLVNRLWWTDRVVPRLVRLGRSPRPER
jgi:dolichol-phosphate mannosyltransferase